MEVDDAFRSLLRREPALMEWLLEEAREEARERDAIALAARGLAPRAVCLSTDPGAMAFDIPIASDAPAPEELIVERMQQLNISLRRTPQDYAARGKDSATKDATADEDVREYSGEDAEPSDIGNAFYLPQRVVAEQWVIGTVVKSENSVIGVLMLLGILDSDADYSEYEVVMTRFFASRVTGEIFEISLARNGMVVVWRDSQLMSRIEVAVYTPARSMAQLGRLVRRATFASLLDCVKCCSPRHARADGFDFPLCRCVNPTHAELKQSFESWDDLVTMCVANMRDSVALKTVYEGDGALIMRSVAQFSARFVKTTCDALPLFSALLLSQAFATPRTAVSNAAEEGRTLLLRLEHNAEKNAVKRSSVVSSAASFLCEECYRPFTSRYNLDRHVLAVHHDRRSFECELCHQRFKLKNHLLVHIRLIHVRDQSHACDQCARRFATASNLKRHVLDTHVKSRDFPCQLCDHRFANKFNLARHITRRHAAELQQAPDRVVLIEDSWQSR